MLCDHCHGRGFIQKITVGGIVAERMLDSNEPKFEGKLSSLNDMLWQPCGECHGCGYVYCCDEAGANQPNVYVHPRGC